MTKRKVPEPPNLNDPIDPDHQAALILGSFATFLAKNPEHEITLTKGDFGFRVEVNQRSVVFGKTLQDGAAQAAQILIFDDVEPAK